MMKTCTTALLLTTILVGCPGGALSQTPAESTTFRHARAFEQAGDLERAAALYRDLWTGAPENTVYFQELQRVLLLAKRYDDAIAVTREQLERAPSDISLQAALGSIYYKAGREREATETWERILSLEPQNPLRYRIIANVLVENRLLERAADVYRRGRKAGNDPNLFTIELAQLLGVSMDYRGATIEYVHWLRNNPSQLGFVQSRMGSFSWNEDARSAAIMVVKSALEENEDVRLYELLGWLYVEGKRFEQALAVFRHIDRLTQSRGEALLAFAGMAFNEHSYEVAANAYFEAIHAPLSGGRMAAAKYGYATALNKLGAARDTVRTPVSTRLPPAPESNERYGEAIAYFRQVIAEFPGTEYAARSYYQVGTIQFEQLFDLDGAIGSFQKVVNEAVRFPALRFDSALKLGEVSIARSDTAQAARWFLQVVNGLNALPEQSDEAEFRLAELDYFTGRFEKAIERLQAISVNLEANYANDALALETFLAVNLESSRGVLPDFARAEHLARQKKYGEAITVMNDVVERSTGLPILDEALLQLASFQEASGRYHEAIVSYERLLAVPPETGALFDRAQFRMGEVYQFGMRDWPRAAASYEALLTKYPGSVFASLARKRMRVLRGEVF